MNMTERTRGNMDRARSVPLAQLAGEALAHSENVDDALGAMAEGDCAAPVVRATHEAVLHALARSAQSNTLLNAATAFRADDTRAEIIGLRQAVEAIGKNGNKPVKHYHRPHAAKVAATVAAFNGPVATALFRALIPAILALVLAWLNAVNNKTETAAAAAHKAASEAASVRTEDKRASDTTAQMLMDAMEMWSRQH